VTLFITIASFLCGCRVTKNEFIQLSKCWDVGNRNSVCAGAFGKKESFFCKTIGVFRLFKNGFCLKILEIVTHFETLLAHH
jgi:hypothetical protein